MGVPGLPRPGTACTQRAVLHRVPDATPAYRRQAGTWQVLSLELAAPDCCEKACGTSFRGTLTFVPASEFNPQIVVNLTSTPVANDEGWWVIDAWVGEKTLADYLRAASWPRERLPRLLLEIARGLEALHNAGIVFRELAPSRVLISDKDGGAVLTDFELAKLLDGAPSVSERMA